MRQVRTSDRLHSAKEGEATAVGRRVGLAAELLDLQHRAGNRVVLRLLARQPLAPPPMPLVNDPLAGTTQGDLGGRGRRGTLRWGREGPEVELLQGRLNQDGAVPPLDVDGRFRDLTRAAVLEFQVRHGLLVDGIVGRQTWGMLDELARAGIAGAHDVMDPTAAVTLDEATAIAHELGTESATGLALVRAGYRSEMVAALDEFYYRALKRRLTDPVTTIEHAGQLRDIAQRLVDDYYSDHILMASRERDLRSPHPGNYTLPVADAATRPLDDAFVKLWVKSNMLPKPPEAESEAEADPRAHRIPRPSEVSYAHHIDTRRHADERLVDHVADLYLRQPGRLRLVKDYIRSYSAEVSSGTAYLGLRSHGWVEEIKDTGPDRLRRVMWDMLSGLMHEYLHKVAHPHFTQVAERLGGTPRKVLLEGFCDYFRKQVWDALIPRFLSDSALRAKVEAEHGTAPDKTQLPADPDVIVGHGYYDERDNAAAIVRALGGGDRGEANVRAAYFMGHVELLGIGPETRGEHLADQLGTWRPTDAADDDLYVVFLGGERVSEIWERAGSTAVKAEATGRFFGPASAGTRLAGGTRLRVRGIRRVRATHGDTRAQVAAQNGVTQWALERANHWEPALGDARIPVGVRILIPAH